jgi:predicted ATP-grasp superfamily ATP-dependent carboligase
VPRVFLYEYITGGGCFSETGSPAPAGSMLVEGEAMRRAVASDFIDAGWQVVSLRDARLAAFDGEAIAVASALEERQRFEEAARSADATLVIAPELGGALLARVRWAEAIGAKLISPGAEFVAIAADKQACCERLQAAGIAVPRGIELTAGEPLPVGFRYPAVLKPIDGAGSTAVRVVRDPHRSTPSEHRRWRLEEFCPGAPASIAALAGPADSIILPACRQRLSDDDSLMYLGGECPLPPELAVRASSLAERVVAAMPPTQGYFGIDLVLGANEREDVAIEVNPRLTTSYVGLRAVVKQNLAAAMVEIAFGRTFALSFSPGGLEFDADGEVRDFDSTRPPESRA